MSKNYGKSLRRINIGCGLSPTPGWDNYDNSLSVWLSRRPILTFIAGAFGLLNEDQRRSIKWNRENPTVQWADATRAIPVADCSAEVIYTSHMVEHLDRDELSRFFQEVRRVLVPGGILRIAVPDLSKIANSYMIDGDADEFFRRMNVEGNKPKTLRQRIQWFVAGPRHHMWMYDGTSLCRLLEENGFVEAKAVPPGETVIPTPEPLNLSERIDESVYVEAKTPKVGSSSCSTRE
jgi:predicted SAM-dependent methyltransferase